MKPSLWILAFLTISGARCAKVQKSSLSNEEITELSEILWNVESTSNSDPGVVLNFQGKAKSNKFQDMADERLFQSVDEAFFQKPTVSAFLNLLDMYNPSIYGLEEEDEINEEDEEDFPNLIDGRSEIENFLNKIIKSPVIETYASYLIQKGLLGDKLQLKNQLRELWFDLYPRQKHMSNAFMHVFVGEIKGRNVNGFHNWISFYLLENTERVDYHGWLKVIDIDEGHSLLKCQFKWGNHIKPAGTMFIGTSPEYEMAVYTLCFVFHMAKPCKIDVNGSIINIMTHKLLHKGKFVIGSAFPT